MTIDPAVHRIAHQFGVDETLIQAVVQAEGGLPRILRAVQCSVPSASSVDEALIITCRSAVHALSDYVRTKDPQGFVFFWGHRWAPVGVANDPHGLNAHWSGNVMRGWLA